MQKAYDLRSGVSEREKLSIAALYDTMVTGDFEAAGRSYTMLAQIYPHDARVFSNLGTIDSYLGEYPESLAAHQEAMKLNPGAGSNYANLLVDYTHTNQLPQAKAVAQAARAHNLDSPAIHANLYLVRFLDHDVAGMARESSQAISSPGLEDLVLYNQSDTAAFDGHFALARQLTGRASEIAARSDKKETMAGYKAEAAVREALAGNFALVRQQASDALALSKGRDVTAMSALALALAGDVSRAARLSDALGQRFPQDTVVRYNLLPTIRAGVALRTGQAPKAIEFLTVAVPFETAQTAQNVNFVLYPVYLRGEAYLAGRHGTAAVTEFQKILDHPGLVQNELIGALAHLGMGRAYGLSHETKRAQAEYEALFSLWKEADSDLPILRQARMEYAKLH